MNIGPYHFKYGLFLAPMSGITDRPFRQLCRSFGAELAFSEMTTSQAQLWSSRKSRLRMDFGGESAPVAVQIAGTDPEEMAFAARNAVSLGAQIVDINMGCPAKKVCHVAAGSALMRDESRIRAILESVVSAVDVPVTLKMRTGWDHDQRNAPAIARLAERTGIQALTVHGRTRADMYNGMAEYDTIRAVKSEVNMPVIANGDICLNNSQYVLAFTGADGIMLGRNVQGQPWVFRQILLQLEKNISWSIKKDMFCQTVLNHITEIHQFYGPLQGTRIARKHIGWYFRELAGFEQYRNAILKTQDATCQIELVKEFLDATHKEEKAA